MQNQDKIKEFMSQHNCCSPDSKGHYNLEGSNLGNHLEVQCAYCLVKGSFTRIFEANEFIWV